MSATILCVQGDREVSRHYQNALEAEGFEVLCAQDGRSGLEVMGRHTPDFVVMDVLLPRQDGFETLAEMRMLPTYQELPVLLLAEGDVTSDLKAQASALGAVGIESAPMAPSDLVARVGQRASAFKSSARSGTFRELPVPELLRALHTEAADGVLLLDHGRKKKAIEFRAGWPVSVKSNLLSECFSNYLVDEGLVSRAQHDECVKRMRTGEGLQGEILVAMHVLDEDAVVSALKAHAVGKFIEIFSWRDGHFEFRPGAHVQRGSTLGIEGHPSRLILEGVRSQYALKQIDRYFESHRESILYCRAKRRDDLIEVGLSEPELAWFQNLGTETRLGDLENTPEELRRLAFGLISVEALAVVANEADHREAMARDAGSGREMGYSAGAGGMSDEQLRVELADLANDMQGKDHYGVLLATPTSTDEEIRASYAHLAKRAHPDRFHSASSSVRQLAAQVFARVSEAHAAIGTATARAAYAQSLSHDRREAAAEQEGRRALQAEMEFQRGEALIASRDYEGALVCFGRAMENFPSEGEYRAHYGWCLYLCHPDNEVMLGEALEHCREGLKLAKDREKPYLLLGRLYKAMGKPGAAKKMFLRAVEIQPQCVEAMRELRIMNMRREKDKGVLKRIFRR
ncbi:MAG: DUF4388 domain-containing protein [Myxococcota bacterium]